MKLAKLVLNLKQNNELYIALDEMNEALEILARRIEKINNILSKALAN